MTDSTDTSNPWVDSWMKMQAEFAKAQAQLTQANAMPANPFDFSGAGFPGAAMSGTTPGAAAQEAWDLCRKQADDWLAAAGNWAQTESTDAEQPDTTATETLRRMMDPTQFLNGGFDEVSKALHQLVDGPELADLGTLERQVLKASREWMAFQEAGVAYRAVVAAAWKRAFDEFSDSVQKDPSILTKESRTVFDHWLRIANQELILTQRTEEFLDAHRILLRAGIEYRIKQRELIEVWCEAYSIPTRTEVDDLHETVYGLRKKLRAQAKQMSELKELVMKISAKGETR